MFKYFCNTIHNRSLEFVVISPIRCRSSISTSFQPNFLQSPSSIHFTNLEVLSISLRSNHPCFTLSTPVQPSLLHTTFSFSHFICTLSKTLASFLSSLHKASIFKVNILLSHNITVLTQVRHNLPYTVRQHQLPTELTLSLQYLF